jgi:hypothetical protein
MSELVLGTALLCAVWSLLAGGVVCVWLAVALDWLELAA